MDQLIPIVNKLQDVFTVTETTAFSLPQIVVIGSQSSGKSSVLESLVQRDFLPRGSDIVTRCPLVLQLHHHELEEEYGEFLHLGNTRLTDFEDIRREIENETDRLAGKNKGIRKEPIRLKIFSKRVVDVTLVDLPGITKIPVGDQPSDIENQIRELIYDFIRHPNTIILAVTPANNDIVNSEAIKLAREVDPNGSRTIGVLTKLDLMDQGTHAMDILCQRGPFKLGLGFVGVVNRSQKDINENVSIKVALKKEGEFFQKHSEYRSLYPRCGSIYLASVLKNILMMLIREKLPEIKNRINTLLVQKQQELFSYGPQTTEHKGTLLLRLVTRFSNAFCDSIDGTSKNVSTTQLCGGARINYVFNDIFRQALMQIDPCGGLKISDIRTVMRNSTGPKTCLFVPEMSFEILVKRQISKLEIPGMRCMELVFEELVKIMNHCEENELARFPALRQKVLATSAQLIRERLAPTSSMIENLVQIELAFINTNHPDFMGAGAAVNALGKLHEKKTRKKSVEENIDPNPAPPKPLPENNGLLNYLFGLQNEKTKRLLRSEDDLMNISMNMSRLEQPPMILEDNSFSSEKEEIETQLIKSLIESYFNVVRKNLLDSIPKSIMHFMVNYCKETIQNRLVSELYREECMDELLKEDEEIAKERSRCRALVDLYRRASAIVNEIRDSPM